MSRAAVEQGDTMLVPLTRGLFARVDIADALRVMERRWCAVSKKQTFYAVRALCDGGRSTLSMHRFLLNAPVGVQVDHIDGNGLNNSRVNLRFATNAMNSANRMKRPGTTSRYKGVHWNKQYGKWRAEITVNWKHLHIGTFDDEIAAACAYDAAARQHFGEFARTNFKDISEHGVVA